jgi:hypothetical protein
MVHVCSVIQGSLGLCVLTSVVSDIIGNIQCDSLKGQTIPTSNGRTSRFFIVLDHLMC